ncbi:uncharacterized protein LOC135821741 [Sycon ciliatum]|uniref:uncharacterized protein LOC135821741 n=1 Tax=Sycon ciliatum TaxID=27933 RepID=UPI0020AE6D02|eukprot:scpid78444/ scgid18773/ 
MAWRVPISQLVLLALLASKALTEIQNTVLTVEECKDVNGNGTEFNTEKCNAGWSSNTTVTQCCQVETREYSYSGNETSNITSSDQFSPGLVCCLEQMCPAEANFTMNEIISCHPISPVGSNEPSLNTTDVGDETSGNVTVATYCCKTLCCQEPESVIPKLVKRLHEVEKINHQWLIILTATVAGCGFIAIAFSLFMCHSHQLWRLPWTRRSKEEEADRGDLSSPSISIDPPSMKMVTREVSEPDYFQTRLPSGLRTAATYNSPDEEEDTAWLLNSVFNGSSNQTENSSHRRGYSDISVVYQHRIQPKHG